VVSKTGWQTPGSVMNNEPSQPELGHGTFVSC